MTAPTTILISGASSGFGALAARRLADAGHHVHAGMRDLTGRNAHAAADARRYAADHDVTLVPVELDVLSDASAAAAVAHVLDLHGRVDVLVHNAGHMVSGPTEAFTPDELAAVYDTNVLGTQRLNRAALPAMRAAGRGLLLWVGSSSTRGGTPPYLAPYFAAKAGMDALAVSYAAEVARFGIETTIIVPGAFTTGTNHFANGGHPADQVTVAAYEQHYPNLLDGVAERLAEITPPHADVAHVATAITDVIAMRHGTHPFRVHIDPIDDGAEQVNAHADQARADFLTRIGLHDLLTPTTTTRTEP